MPRKGPRLRVGDVFSIPLDDERVGYGQIVFRRRGVPQYYFAVFGDAYPRGEQPDLDRLLAQRPALLALSFDALLHNGDWEIVGNREVDEARIPWPAYKVGGSGSGSVEVVDYTGERSRPASADEAQRLPYETTVAPVLVEDAFRALHDLEPWDAEFDDLLPPADDELTTARLF